VVKGQEVDLRVPLWEEEGGCTKHPQHLQEYIYAEQMFDERMREQMNK
jgi:hypothetical protein